MPYIFVKHLLPRKVYVPDAIVRAFNLLPVGYPNFLENGLRYSYFINKSVTV